jgi:hypothetical protein
MTNPGKLCARMAESKADSVATTKSLHRIARKIGALDDGRRELNYRYAADQISGDEFIAASRALDEKRERLLLEKAKLAAALRSPEHEDFVDASVRQFCANANARLQACADDDDKRTFLLDHIGRVVYDHYDVAVIGAVPVHTIVGTAKLPFRIEGTINIKKVHSASLRKAALKLLAAEAASAGTPTVACASDPLSEGSAQAASLREYAQVHGMTVESAGRWRKRGEP